VLVIGTIRTQTWTPQDGRKERSKQVVVASAVGPELRYATAKPVKTARTDSGPDGTVALGESLAAPERWLAVRSDCHSELGEGCAEPVT
jgi:single-stranded DNA-binding protein